MIIIAHDHLDQHSGKPPNCGQDCFNFRDTDITLVNARATLSARASARQRKKGQPMAQHHLLLLNSERLL